jgi:hypothetical protein
MEQVENHQRACVLRSFAFLRKAELGFFHFLEIVTGWLVPSTVEEKRRSPPLVENRFLQAGKGTF